MVKSYPKQYAVMTTPRSQQDAREEDAVSSIISRIIAKGGPLLAADALAKLRRLEPAVAEIEELAAEYGAVGLALHSGRLTGPLTKLRPRMSNAERILDGVVERERQILALPDKSNPFYERSWMRRTLNTIFHASRPAAAPEIKRLNKRLHKAERLVDEARRSFQPPRDLLPNNPAGSPPPKVVGRDAECRKLVAVLYDDEYAGDCRPYSVVGIYGAAGSGKTTLAQCAFARARTDDGDDRFFDLCVWVHVRRGSTTHEVLLDMTKAATGRPSGDMVSSLEDALRGKRLLLVLDGVRCNGAVELKRVLAPLDVAGAESKVLVTARSVDALLVLGAAATSGCIPVRELDDDVFLRLFMHYALGDAGGGDERDRGILQVIGADIATKLNRSPLAAKLLGTELRAKPQIEFWRSVRDTLFVDN